MLSKNHNLMKFPLPSNSNSSSTVKQQPVKSAQTLIMHGLGDSLDSFSANVSSLRRIFSLITLCLSRSLFILL